MKRYIFILIAVFSLLACANAQIEKNKTFSSNRWVVEDELSSSDTLGTLAGDSVLTYTIKANKPDDLFYDVNIELDSISGTPDFLLDLKGKVFENDAWTDLETDIAWKGTSSDTTVVFQEHSTAVFMRYFQVQVNGQASTGTARVDKISLKIWP